MNYEELKRATVNSAGYDIKCPFEVELRPGEWVKINTGLKFDGYEVVKNFEGYYKNWFMAIFPRSSLGMKYGMRFSNTVGIIDQDYRGPIMLDVTVDRPYTVQKGERIAQGILLPFLMFNDEKEPVTERNGGMGSTGVL